MEENEKLHRPIKGESGRKDLKEKYISQDIWVQKESNLRRLRYEQSILPLNYEPGRKGKEW
jgi:hypothetical protein